VAKAELPSHHDLDRLYKDYCRYVAAILLRICGRRSGLEDGIQDVFVEAAANIAQLRQPEAIRGWLATIAVRVARRSLRRRRLTRLFGLAPAASEYENLADPSASPFDRALLSRLYHALDQLPVDDRVAYVLHHVEGETLEAVATVDDRNNARRWPLSSRAASEPAPVVSTAADPAAPRASADFSAVVGARAESAQELLKLADAARARGDAALGAELLRRILRDHAKDPRAPLAALSLGRLLLGELHRPAEAAAAFEQVELLAPGSPFAEDALAHQAEAWLAAARPDKSRQLATAYLKRYPTGRHAQHMRALAWLALSLNWGIVF
jgi:RNA polymerase sigma factor (sigma-70 family)